MKHLISLCLCASVLNLSAVPLRWTVETSRAQPATFEAYQGETLELEAALTSYGNPLEAPSNYSLYWQTNGMGSTWWSTNLSNVSNLSNHSNLLRATWRPEYDIGAKTYTCFIGQPGTIYHAAFQLRLRPSPGAVPNELPLPAKTIDFAQVIVTNAPWITEESDPTVPAWAKEPTPPRSADGAARPLPKYLHALDFDDSYPDDAAWYYEQQQQNLGGCSSVRDGGFLYRNYDWKFDDAAEFVIRCVATAPSPSCPSGRFASIGVANVGTNLTEQFVTSGEWSRYYKCLPGHTVDGINSEGVVCNINVVTTNGAPWEMKGERDINALGAVRWVLDTASSAEYAASNLAFRVFIPESLKRQGFSAHFMIADKDSTYIVENGVYSNVTGRAVMTNFPLLPTRGAGEGQERYDALMGGANITSQWWTLTYTPSGYRASDLPGITGGALAQLFEYWGGHSRESHRGESFGGVSWWQTVHTSVYDITNKVLRVAVQETDDWYTFAVPTAGTDEDEVTRIASNVVAVATKDFVTETITNGLVTASITNGLVTASITNGLVTSSITNGLASSKRDKTDFSIPASWIVTIPAGSIYTDQSKFSIEFDLESMEAYAYLKYDGSEIGRTENAIPTATHISFGDHEYDYTVDGLVYVCDFSADSIARSSEVVREASAAEERAVQRATDGTVRSFASVGGVTPGVSGGVADLNALFSIENTNLNLYDMRESTESEMSAGAALDQRFVVIGEDVRTLENDIEDLSITKADKSDISATNEVFGSAVRGVVDQQYIREKLEVYLYVGEDGGIYVHTN